MIEIPSPASRKRLASIIRLLGLALTLLTVSCRDKDTTVTGPGPNPNGSWSLSLENVTALYITVTQEGILGDTVNVRLFEPDGSLAIGMPVRFGADFDSNRVILNTNTTDTSGSHPWGCEPALYYWGDGSPDQDNPVEVIHAYFIDQTTHDTLARAERSYQILHR